MAAPAECPKVYCYSIGSLVANRGDYLEAAHQREEVSMAMGQNHHLHIVEGLNSSTKASSVPD